MLNIAVFASGNGSNLEVLLNTPFKNGKITLVVSNNPKAYALERAKNHQIPSIAIPRCDYPSQQAFEECILKHLKEHHIDCIVLAGFMLILSPFFIQHFPNKIINIHPSLIPAFCGEGFYGIKVHEAALQYGVKVSGASVHFVNEIVDGGQIIAQKAISISKQETPQSLQKKISALEHKLLPKGVQILINQTIQAKRK